MANYRVYFTYYISIIIKGGIMNIWITIIMIAIGILEVIIGAIETKIAVKYRKKRRGGY